MTAATGAAEAVVLVHGLWMRGWVLAWMGMWLRRCGYAPHLFSYPSRSATLLENAASLARFAASLPAARVHFVGHSLGGLVILKMLELHPDLRAGRIVLLGSPYGGNRAALALAGSAAGRWLLGPCLLQWLALARPDVGNRHELGVLAGCRSLGLGRLIVPLAQPNDGVVAVAETGVPGMKDQTILPVSHSGMMLSRQVARQVCAFLKNGCFIRPH